MVYHKNHAAITWVKSRVLYISSDVLIVVYIGQRANQLFSTDTCYSESLRKFDFSQSVDSEIIVICTRHADPLVIMFDLHTYSHNPVEASKNTTRPYEQSLTRNYL